MERKNEYVSLMKITNVEELISEIRKMAERHPGVEWDFPFDGLEYRDCSPWGNPSYITFDVPEFTP